MCSYVGNEYSGIVHVDLSDCVAKMHPANQVFFEELYHALSDGYEECQYCVGFWGSDEAVEFAQLKQERLETYLPECLVCGESRGVQRAHIVPRSKGGKTAMPLCPNHHWNYDHGLLTDGELKRVIDWIRREHGKKLSVKIRQEYMDKRHQCSHWAFGEDHGKRDRGQFRA